MGEALLEVRDFAYREREGAYVVTCKINDPIALMEWLTYTMSGEFDILNWDDLIKKHQMGHAFKTRLEKKPLIRDYGFMQIQITPQEPDWPATIRLNNAADVAIMKLKFK